MDSGASSLYRFGDLLALARQSWIVQVRARMADRGFPEYRRTDAAVLRLLAQRPWPIGQLGAALGITRQAARKLADGLVERGYATFGTDPADARRTLVTLTPAGLAYAREVAQAQDSLNGAMATRVTAAELAAADGVLRAVFPDDEARRRAGGLVPPPVPPVPRGSPGAPGTPGWARE